MLVNDTPVNYAFVLAAKYAFGYVGLGCFLYFLAALFIGGLPAISMPFSIFVEAYGLIEIMWYLFWFLPFKAYLQRPGLPMAATTRAERKALFETSLDQVPDTRLFIRKWFNNAHLDEIYRDDVKDWLMWFLWGTDNEAGIETDELEEYINLLETKADLILLRGRAGAKPIRLNLDRVQMVHRSLLFYVLIGFLDNLSTIVLLVKGFSFYRQPRASFFKVFPFRLMTLFSMKESASPHYSYVYRPHKSKEHRPIVFFHGIGVGLSTYMKWLSTIPKDIGVLAVEILPISGRICPEALPRNQFQQAMRQILYQHGIEDFVFVGHSYGTLLARPLLDAPAIAPMIDSFVLCDPVTFLLHLPDVAYNTTTRVPKTAPELQMAIAASLDPRAAHTMTRRLHWPEHVLTRENLLGTRATAIVASRDCVLNADAMAGYLYYGDASYITSADLGELKNTPELWTGQAELELLYLFDRDHGQCLVEPTEARKVTDVVVIYAKLDQGPDPRLDAKMEVEEEQDVGDGKTLKLTQSAVTVKEMV